MACAVLHQHVRTFEKGRPPTTLTGLPSTALQFQARLKSPRTSICCMTLLAGPSRSALLFFHLLVRRRKVRQVHASWFPSMTSFDIGACTIYTAQHGFASCMRD
jgi:hypothetical protein